MQYNLPVYSMHIDFGLPGTKHGYLLLNIVCDLLHGL